MSLITLQRKATSSAGSFYVRTLGAEDRALLRTTAQLAFRHGAAQRILSPAAQGQPSPSAYVELPWKAGDVVRFGADIVPAGGQYLLTSNSELQFVRKKRQLSVDAPGSADMGVIVVETEEYEFVFTNTTTTGTNVGVRFWVPMPVEYEPWALTTLTGETLLAGVDFFAGYGFIELSEDPEALFGTGNIRVRAAARASKNILAFPARGDARWRNPLSGSEFVAALAAEINLPYASGAVTAAVRQHGYCRVEVGGRTVKTSRPITLPAVGRKLTTLETVGGEIRLTVPNPENANWYRQVSWTQEFTPLRHFPDVTVADKPVKFNAGPADPVTSAATREAVLTGTEARQAEFWVAYHEAERHQTVRLATVTTAGEVANGLDVFLSRLGLSKNLWILELWVERLTDEEIYAIESAVRLHAPLGVRTLVVQRAEADILSP